MYYLDIMDEPLFLPSRHQDHYEKPIIMKLSHVDKQTTSMKVKQIDRMRRRGRVLQSDIKSISLDASQPVPPTMLMKGGLHYALGIEV